MLSQNEQLAALRLARTTLQNYFDPVIKVNRDYSNFSVFDENRGVFVTLHDKQGNLRGCIGRIDPGGFDLADTIKMMAMAAAFEDPRFEPLTWEELEDIKIEISVLTELRLVTDAREIEIPRHGVVVEKNGRSGVFLPQVAEETGWNKEEFLNHLCADKAGLPAGAWQDKDVKLKVFEAEVFSE